MTHPAVIREGLVDYGREAAAGPKEEKPKQTLKKVR